MNHQLNVFFFFSILCLSQQDVVKLQILNLASKLCLSNPKQTKVLCQYVFRYVWKSNFNYNLNLVYCNTRLHRSIWWNIIPIQYQILKCWFNSIYLFIGNGFVFFASMIRYGHFYAVETNLIVWWLDCSIEVFAKSGLISYFSFPLQQLQFGQIWSELRYSWSCAIFAIFGLPQ